MKVLLERCRAVRAGLSPLPDEWRQLRRLGSESYSIIGNILWRYDLLLVAYSACLAAIVLTNDRHAPRTIFFAAVLPIAFFVSLGFAKRVLQGSVIFWAVAVYLVAMGVTSLMVRDVPMPDIVRHYRLIPLILIYLIVIARLATDPRSLKRLLLVSSAIVAMSALVNVATYLAFTGAKCPAIVSNLRLCAVIGMPDYVNSTNLSAPYALYAVAAIALLVHVGPTTAERVVLSIAAAILVAGVIFTEARSGMLAAILGCSVLAACSSRTFRLLFVGAAVVAVIVVVMVPHLRELLLLRGLSYRPELWTAYFQMALDRPLLGVGVIENIDVRMRDGATVDQAHNIVLSAFVRSGLVGALAMFTVLAVSVVSGIRFWLKTRSAIPLALIVTMIGYSMLDYQLLVTYPTWPWITFWFPIAICVAAEILLRQPRPPVALPAFR